INTLKTESVSLAEPVPPKQASFRTEAEALEQGTIQLEIESVGARSATKEELGTTIREGVEEALETSRDSYRPLYAEAEEAAETIYHVPQATAQEAGNRLLRIGRMATRP